jgi:hypothetical protein
MTKPRAGWSGVRIPAGSNDFSSRSRPEWIWGPPSYLFSQWIRVFSPEVKRPGRDTDHSSLSPLVCLRGVGGDSCNMTRPRVLSEKKLNTQALNTEIIKQQTKRRNCIPQVVKWKLAQCKTVLRQSARQYGFICFGIKRKRQETVSSSHN